MSVIQYVLQQLTVLFMNEFMPFLSNSSFSLASFYWYGEEAENIFSPQIKCSLVLGIRIWTWGQTVWISTRVSSVTLEVFLISWCLSFASINGDNNRTSRVGMRMK